MLRLTEVVKHLLILNVLMFLISLVLKDSADVLALHYPASEKFQPYQFATYFFMHANFPHLLFNMFALWMFGTSLEALWGPKRFLFYYFFCAFGAAIVHLLYSYYDFSQYQHALEVFKVTPNYDTFWAFFSDVPRAQLNMEVVEKLSKGVLDGDSTAIQYAISGMQDFLDAKMDTATVGASGAIFGVLLAFGMKFPETELMLIFLPIPFKAKYFIPVLMIIELFLGVNQFSWDNIAHFAHLGGAFSGLLLILYWRKFGSRW